jgi:modulator of FtsH protease
MSTELRSYSSATPAGAGGLLTTHSVLRNTYLLLSATLLFSAFTAGIGMAISLPYGVSMITSLLALGLIWFALPRTANSEKGIYVVFAVTGLMGLGLAPMLNHYLKTYPHGGEIIMSALAGTGIIFGALSAYVLTTKKDFSFMGGFLMVGLLVLIVTSLGAVVAGLFGVNITGVQLALSAVSMLLFSGLILFDTSRIIHGGETNYVLATIALYLDIYNIFVSLLQLLGYADRRN